MIKVTQLRAIPILIIIIFFSMQHASAQLPLGVKTFSLSELAKIQKQDQKKWLGFLDEPTIEAGIYQLKAGEKDPQQPHEFDEIYYVLEGEALLKAGDSSFPSIPGSVSYVRAMVAHQFIDIKKDLTVLVLFSKARPSSDDPPARSYNLTTIENSVSTDSITWSGFHRCSTMSLGNYSLPQKTGGDKSLIHKVDEINIVLKSGAKFSVSGIDIDVKKGDIIFVPKDNDHFFHDLKDDFEVLILFEKKSIQK